jgi:putative oxidoreductase
MSTTAGAGVAPKPPRAEAGASPSKLEGYAPHMLSILRLLTGLLFIEHGLVKLAHFPAASPAMPDPLPPLLVAAAVIEVVGGLLVAVGLSTRVTALICSGEMAVGYFMAHAPRSFWPAVNQGEGAILYCFLFLFFVFAGGGTWGADAIFKKRS